MIRVRVLSVEEWPLWRELRLEALREAPYAFSSKLSDWQGNNDTEARWRGRLENVPFNIVAELDGKPAGVVGAALAETEDDVALISMWVAPFARGHGVGDALVGAVIKWAMVWDARRVVLDVRESNERALALYRRHGFVDDELAASRSEDEPAEKRMALVLK